jgi:phage-related protein
MPTTLILRPTGDVAAGSWAPYPVSPSTLWDKVDDDVSDDDATYIEAAGTDAALFTTLPLSTGTPVSVTVKAMYKPAGAGAAQSAWVRVAGPGYGASGSLSNISGTSYVLVSYTWAARPSLGSPPWALADINALSFGVDSGLAGQRVSQVWLEVTMSESPWSVSASDTGSGVDAVSCAVGVGVPEGAQTAQAAVGSGAVYDPSLDTGLGADVAAIVATPSTIADTGAGADAASVRATIAALADTGLGADGVSALVTMLLADTGAGVDAASVLATLSTLTETGAGTDAASVGAALATIADTGTGVDAVLNLLAIHVYVRSDGRVDPLGVILLQGGREDILPSVREQTEDIPARSGSVDFGADVGARGLELRVASAGGLTAAQKTALKRYVAGWLRPALGVWNIAWEDDPDRYLQVRVAGNVQPEEYADYLEFTIPLKASQPMYLGSVLQSLTGSGTATCEGNVETPVTVAIRGPITNPAVTVAGAAFTWTGTVGAGDSLVVDGARMTVTFNGVNALSGFSGTFPTLQPGDNTITAAAAGVTTVTWRDRWI